MATTTNTKYLMQGMLAIDLSICPDCGGRLRVIADVSRPGVINKIRTAVARHVARQQAPPAFSAISKDDDGSLTFRHVRGEQRCLEDQPLLNQPPRMCMCGHANHQPFASCHIADEFSTRFRFAA